MNKKPFGLLRHFFAYYQWPWLKGGALTMGTWGLKNKCRGELYRWCFHHLQIVPSSAGGLSFFFIVIHTVKGFGIVNKAEIDVFLRKHRWHLKNLFILGCAGSSLLAQAFTICPSTEWRLLSSCHVRPSHCSGLSWCGAGVLEHKDFSSFSSWVLEWGLSHCGAETCLPSGMWSLPGPGIKSKSLHWQGDS